MLLFKNAPCLDNIKKFSWLMSQLNFCLFAFFTQTSFAQSTVAIQTLEQLANHPQWQHLIFYKNGRGEVISPNFYLSNLQANPKQKIDPYQELQATINSIHDQQTICKYPARYFWLSHQLNKKIDLSRCSNLPNPKQEISLLLVSSYLKNPASTFGHVLIKTNLNEVNNKNKNVADTSPQGQIISSKDLLDQSYNFGARIPTNENGIFYILKGLFGIYDAGFSKSEFFKQDAVYSKSEQRDMWEYVLNLNERDKTLLNYHLYEAESARFRYYFIKQNCGYRSGQLLELFGNIDTTNRIGGWYAPEFIFNQLEESQNKNNLIQEVKYLPSEQTQLREKFQTLPNNLQKVINTFIENESLHSLEPLSVSDKTLVTDFLLTHRAYLLSQADNDKDQKHHEKVSNKLVKLRFTLPIGNTFNAIAITNKPSPAMGNKTTQTQVSISEHDATIGLSLFTKDPLNQFTDINKKFEAVKLSAKLDYDEGKADFNEFVFLDMQQVEDISHPLYGEPNVSWQIKTGVQVDPMQKNSIQNKKYIPYIDLGVGSGVEFNPNLLGYGFVNAHFHDQHQFVDPSVSVGIRAKKDNNAAQLTYQLRMRENLKRQEAQLTLRHGFTKNQDIRLKINHSLLDDHDALNSSITYNYYW